MKSDLSKFDNSWYHPGAAWKRMSWYFVNVLFLKSSLLPFSSLRVMLLRLFGARIGKGVVIKPSVNIKYAWKLEVGDYSWIGENVWIDNLAEVKIGANVCISQGAMLLCGNHDYKKETFNLMIGGIIPGVTLHSHAVLGVASVAHHDLDAFTIYHGNPAKEVRKRIIS